MLSKKLKHTKLFTSKKLVKNYELSCKFSITFFRDFKNDSSSLIYKEKNYNVEVIVPLENYFDGDKKLNDIADFEFISKALINKWLQDNISSEIEVKEDTLYFKLFSKKDMNSKKLYAIKEMNLKDLKEVSYIMNEEYDEQLEFMRKSINMDILKWFNCLIDKQVNIRKIKTV